MVRIRFETGTRRLSANRLSSFSSTAGTRVWITRSCFTGRFPTGFALRVTVRHNVSRRDTLSMPRDAPLLLWRSSLDRLDLEATWRGRVQHAAGLPEVCPGAAQRWQLGWGAHSATGNGCDDDGEPDR